MTQTRTLRQRARNAFMQLSDVPRAGDQCVVTQMVEPVFLQVAAQGMRSGDGTFRTQNRHAIKIGQLCLQNMNQLREALRLIVT